MVWSGRPFSNLLCVSQTQCSAGARLSLRRPCTLPADSSDTCAGLARRSRLVLDQPSPSSLAHLFHLQPIAGFAHLSSVNLVQTLTRLLATPAMHNLILLCIRGRYAHAHPTLRAYASTRRVALGRLAGLGRGCQWGQRAQHLDNTGRNTSYLFDA